MNKILKLTVIFFSLFSAVEAKETYLSCLWEDFYNKEGIKKIGVVEDLIIDTKKKNCIRLNIIHMIF